MKNLKTQIKIILLVLLLYVVLPNQTLSQTASAGTVPARERLNMDFDWRFALGDADDPAKDFDPANSYFTYLAKAGNGAGAAAADFDDRSWRTVNLPNDWAVALPFDNHGSASHGYKAIGLNFPQNSVGWYRKKFFIPASDFGKHITVEFEGAFRDSQVWVNGFYLGRESSGYTSFSYNLTDYLNYGGDNTIAVRVNASLEEGWFYEGAGVFTGTSGWLKLRRCTSPNGARSLAAL
ncbi:MAG: sugar-binding domain-containing protein [Limisphaerales bacterium]